MHRLLAIVPTSSFLRGISPFVALVLPLLGVNTVSAADEIDSSSTTLQKIRNGSVHGFLSGDDHESKLRDDVQKYRVVEASAPGSTLAKEASMNEARALVSLGSNADASEKQRRRELAKLLSSDPAIPEKHRFEVVAGVANVEVASDNSLNRVQKIECFASVARTLIHDFPGQAESYASLLRIARDSDPVAASKIAHELLKYAGTPTEVQNGARTLLRRLDLIGVSLGKISKDLSPDRDKSKTAVCIYSWSVLSPRSIVLGSTLRKIAPANTRLIAICIDSDVDTAKASAAKLGVVGDQLVFSGGNNEVYQKLCMDEPSLAYIADTHGQVVSIVAYNWLCVQKKWN